MPSRSAVTHARTGYQCVLQKCKSGAPKHDGGGGTNQNTQGAIDTTLSHSPSCIDKALRTRHDPMIVRSAQTTCFAWTRFLHLGFDVCKYFTERPSHSTDIYFSEGPHSVGNNTVTAIRENLSYKDKITRNVLDSCWGIPDRW